MRPCAVLVAVANPGDLADVALHAVARIADRAQLVQPERLVDGICRLQWQDRSQVHQPNRAARSLTPRVDIRVARRINYDHDGRSGCCVADPFVDVNGSHQPAHGAIACTHHQQVTWLQHLPRDHPSCNFAPRSCPESACTPQERLVASLSVLELFVLVSAARVQRRRTTEAINFEMAWREYAHLGALNPHADRYSKAAALRAWEQLAHCALLTPLDGR